MSISAPRPATTIVVPCYNEARRLDARAFLDFVQSRAFVRLVLVNDGSGDRTLSLLRDIARDAGDRVDVLDLAPNGGKAEAVRQGLLHALAARPEFVGFWDADLSTPLQASDAFVDLLTEKPTLEMVIGARVLMLGRTIERRALRHYAGRVFATAASLVLRLPVYDTQCGAKLFRASPRLANAVAEPFRSRWVFDVELIARYGALPTGYSPELLREWIYEFPLFEWHDVAGSKVAWLDFGSALLELARIRTTYVTPRRNGR